MKKVCLLTSFADFQRAYSLNIIVQYQIKMLLLNGYEPTVIVHDTFKPEGIYAHPAVTIEKIPNVPCHNEVKKDETFDADVQAIETRLVEILKDKDVVITHDIVYQNACLKHNFAARKVAKKYPQLKWLHWIHSATSPLLLNMVRPLFQDEYISLLQTPFPNAKYVYPNTYATPAVAANFGVSIEDVITVHHPTDIAALFEFPLDVEEFVYDKKLLEADAITVYPARLDRGKQVEYVIKTMACLKHFDLSVRVIIADFHSTGGDKLTYRDELKQIAIDYGLSEGELIFLSEYKDEWRHEVSQSVIGNIQLLGNVFIMPSVSETYSLTTQEAALTKQVVVLNQDFPPFRSIYGENAIYRKYSSGFDVLAEVKEAVRPDSWTGTKYGAANLPEEARKSAEKAYHLETAGMIAQRLHHPEIALSTFLRKNRSLQAVFKKEIEHLLY